MSFMLSSELALLRVNGVSRMRGHWSGTKTGKGAFDQNTASVKE